MSQQSCLQKCLALQRLAAALRQLVPLLAPQGAPPRGPRVQGLVNHLLIRSKGLRSSLKHRSFPGLTQQSLLMVFLFCFLLTIPKGSIPPTTQCSSLTTAPFLAAPLRPAR